MDLIQKLIDFVWYDLIWPCLCETYEPGSFWVDSNYTIWPVAERSNDHE